MSGPSLNHEEMLRILAVVIAHHDTQSPLTTKGLGEALGLGPEAGRVRRNRLLAEGWITIELPTVPPGAPRGARGGRLIPTDAARALKLPEVTIAPKKSAGDTRSCFRCRESFVSTGSHHQHCDRCRSWIATVEAGGSLGF